MKKNIQQYLQKCWKEYKEVIGLAASYKYLHGNPVKVHVPIDIAQYSYFIIGAYPTALFHTIDGIHDVPVADHLYPFSNDTYFDGSRIRRVKSGEELERFYLKKLNVQRSDCWITDLVKVFLFKAGHIKKYEVLGYTQQKANRNQFMQIAQASLPYLDEELQLAQPKLVITLGEEVTAAVMGISKLKANQTLQEIQFHELERAETTYKVLALPHPGILMRAGAAAEKWGAIANQKLELVG